MSFVDRTLHHQEGFTKEKACQILYLESRWAISPVENSTNPFTMQYQDWLPCVTEKLSLSFPREYVNHNWRPLWCHRPRTDAFLGSLNIKEDSRFPKLQNYRTAAPVPVYRQTHSLYHFSATPFDRSLVTFRLFSGTGYMAEIFRNDAKYGGEIDLVDGSMKMLYIASKRPIRARYRHCSMGTA